VSSKFLLFFPRRRKLQYPVRNDNLVIVLGRYFCISFSREWRENGTAKKFVLLGLIYIMTDYFLKFRFVPSLKFRLYRLIL
jgi:hypothetical protein